jgi:hypothetical protein
MSREGAAACTYALDPASAEAPRSSRHSVDLPHSAVKDLAELLNDVTPERGFDSPPA